MDKRTHTDNIYIHIRIISTTNTYRIWELHGESVWDHSMEGGEYACSCARVTCLCACISSYTPSCIYVETLDRTYINFYCTYMGMWITRILPRLLRVIPTFYAFSGHDSDLDFGRRHKVLGTFSASSMDSGILHFPRSQRRDWEGWREGGEWLDCNASYTQKECAHTHVTKHLVDYYWKINPHAQSQYTLILGLVDVCKS